MQIVIEISDKLIKKVKDYYVNPYEVDEICEAILDGTPLPEHHGRLIDADNMIERLHSENGMPRTRNEEYAWNFAVELFKKAPTIIEGSDSE